MRFVSARLAAYYVAHFTCTGIQLPFWAVWLASLGLEADTIGLLLSLGYWISIATSPLAGWISDRVGGARAPMTVLASIALAGFVAFAYARDVATLGALAVITFGAYAALLPLAESIVQARCHPSLPARERADYGRVRLWGSLAFIAASSCAGWAIHAYDASVVPWLMAGGAAACLLAAQALPRPVPSPLVTRAAPATAYASASPRTIAWAPLLAGIVLASAIQASHAVYYGFGSLEWAARGLDPRSIGALWALGVVAEIALFALSPSIVSRVGPSTLLALGAVGATLRWIALALVDHPLAVAAAQLLHAISFGATHIGGMELVRRSVPAHRLATGQGAYTAIAGIAFGLATPIAGALYERWRGDAYVAAACLAGLSAIVALTIGRRIVARATGRRGGGLR